MSNSSALKHLNLMFLQMSILLVTDALGGLLSTIPLAISRRREKYLRGIFFYFIVTWSRIVNFLSASASRALSPSKSLALYSLIMFSDLTKFIFLSEAGWFYLFKGFHCIGYFLFRTIIGLAVLDVGFIVLSEVLPAFLIAAFGQSGLVSQLRPDPCPRRKNQSICITQGILIAENLTTVPAVNVPPEQRLKLSSHLKQLWTSLSGTHLSFEQGGLNNLANLFVHDYTINNSLLFYKMTNYYNAFLSQHPTTPSGNHFISSSITICVWGEWVWQI